MGYIPSADTVYAVAYLTETGRNYLFNKDNNRFDSDGDDLFEITKFSISDVDTNYQTNQLLKTGEVPDVTGAANNTCLKTAANYVQTNLVAYIFDNTPTNVTYNTDLNPGTPQTLLIQEASLPNISPSEVIPGGTTTTTSSGPTGIATILTGI